MTNYHFCNINIFMTQVMVMNPFHAVISFTPSDHSGLRMEQLGILGNLQRIVRRRHQITLKDCGNIAPERRCRLSRIT